MPSLILRAATPVLMVLLIIVSIYALLRGHHEPGGGFTGGLIIASAFSLHILAYDAPSTRQLLRVSPQTLRGLGLATILLSGVTGLMAGGSELEELTHELEQAGAEDTGLREVAQVFEQEVAELHVGEMSPQQPQPPSGNTGARPDSTTQP